MGGFEFATTDTAEVDEYMAVCDIKWIETEHFELGFGLAVAELAQRDLPSKRASHCFSIGSDSPVSAASWILRLAAQQTRPSAGT